MKVEPSVELSNNYSSFCTRDSHKGEINQNLTHVLSCPIVQTNDGLETHIQTTLSFNRERNILEICNGSLFVSAKQILTQSRVYGLTAFLDNIKGG